MINLKRATLCVPKESLFTTGNERVGAQPWEPILKKTKVGTGTLGANLFQMLFEQVVLGGSRIK